MASLEAQFQTACDAREIPGVILLSSDGQGTFDYAKAFGPATPTSPMSLDSTFIMASCTKLMTSIAAMQCVERGLIGLDDAVSHVLPELKDLKILVECEAEKEPVYRDAETAITLRHLLTHTSGLGYDMMVPLYHAWRASRNEAPGIRGMPILQRISVPLLFEPGSSFVYGVSHDWIGILIERLTSLSLEAYMSKNIWSPLNIKTITFHTELNPDVKKNKVQMTIRKGIPLFGDLPFQVAPTEEGVDWTDALVYDDPIADAYGGQGAIGSPIAYMKILTSLLPSSTTPLLSASSIDQMFTPQLSPPIVPALAGLLLGGGFASPPLGTELNFGLGSALVMSQMETGRGKGTLYWSGMPNLLWSVDRNRGLACMYASNVMPFADYRSGEMQVLFEREMYRQFGEGREGR